jgi:hypothetical protein
MVILDDVRSERAENTHQSKGEISQEHDPKQAGGTLWRHGNLPLAELSTLS